MTECKLLMIRGYLDPGQTFCKTDSTHYICSLYTTNPLWSSIVIKLNKQEQYVSGQVLNEYYEQCKSLFGNLSCISLHSLLPARNNHHFFLRVGTFFFEFEVFYISLCSFTLVSQIYSNLKIHIFV